MTCATCLIEDSYPDLTKRMKFVDKLNEQAFQKMGLNENVLPKRSRREGLRQDRFPYNMPSMLLQDVPAGFGLAAGMESAHRYDRA